MGWLKVNQLERMWWVQSFPQSWSWTGKAGGGSRSCQWERGVPGAGAVYCFGVHRGTWVSPLSLEPPGVCRRLCPCPSSDVAAGTPLGQCQGCLVTPLTLLDPEGCWAPWALLCGMLWMLGLAPTQTAAQPRGSAESRTAWGHIGVSAPGRA